MPAQYETAGDINTHIFQLVKKMFQKFCLFKARKIAYSKSFGLFVKRYKVEAVSKCSVLSKAKPIILYYTLYILNLLF